MNILFAINWGIEFWDKYDFLEGKSGEIAAAFRWLLNTERGARSMFLLAFVSLIFTLLFEFRRGQPEPAEETETGTLIDKERRQLNERPTENAPSPREVARSVIEARAAGCIPEVITEPRETLQEQKIEDAQTEHKLEILFGNGPPYRKARMVGEEGNVHDQEVCVGVKNLSGVEAINNLRVEVAEVTIDGIMHRKVPLRELYDAPPYKREFTLNPGDEMFFRLIRRISNEDPRFTFYNATPELVPEVLEYKLHVLEIVASGSNAPQRTLHIRIYPNRYGTLGADLRIDQPQGVIDSRHLI